MLTRSSLAIKNITFSGHFKNDCEMVSISLFLGRMICSELKRMGQLITNGFFITVIPTHTTYLLWLIGHLCSECFLEACACERPSRIHRGFWSDGTGLQLRLGNFHFGWNLGEVVISFSFHGNLKLELKEFASVFYILFSFINRSHSFCHFRDYFFIVSY